MPHFYSAFPGDVIQHNKAKIRQRQYVNRDTNKAIKTDIDRKKPEIHRKRR